MARLVGPTGNYIISGGTGRFSDAAGQATFIATTSDFRHLSVRFQGTISY